MTETTQTEKLAVLLFTDIVGSVDIQRRLGTDRYTALLNQHDELFGRHSVRSKEAVYYKIPAMDI